MTKIIKFFYGTEHKFDAVAERFFFHHPYLGFFTAFIGMILSISLYTFFSRMFELSSTL